MIYGKESIGTKYVRYKNFNIQIYGLYYFYNNFISNTYG